VKVICSVITVLSIFHIFTTNVLANENHPEEAFFMANQAYKEGRFQDAIDGYEELLESGYSNGSLYFNLGNCYFRLEQLGKAILNYERANLLIPRDADLNFNLRFARDQTQDAIADQHGFFEILFFWTDSLTTYELYWGFAVLNILFWGILFIRLFSKMEWTYYATIIILIFWIITGASFGWKYYQLRTDDRAVILKKEIDILAGPAQGDTVLFKLHEGTIVNYERSEDDWSLISYSKSKRGWVRAQTLEKINYK
jgi:tetratricopeptide (TPR) repeat protein